VRERIVEMPFDLPAEPFGHAGQQVRQSSRREIAAANCSAFSLMSVFWCLFPKRRCVRAVSSSASADPVEAQTGGYLVAATGYRRR
jgi:hypothetical protein